MSDGLPASLHTTWLIGWQLSLVGPGKLCARIHTYRSVTSRTNHRRRLCTALEQLKQGGPAGTLGPPTNRLLYGSRSNPVAADWIGKRMRRRLTGALARVS